MSNVEKFENLLASDDDLQAKVRAASEAFQNDTADDQAVFDAVIAPIASEAGLPFTYDEAKEFAASGSELSDAELEAVAGGFCLYIGTDESVDSCDKQRAGATACKVYGVGFFTTK